ncbi:MAG: transcription antitermination factor NusB [Eubacteriales bacterium]|nr:transcription antitermination factor NusB [Clostridiales bacterium]MDY5836936.1 transcription antitermination factor NusB [Eubacteriales bacterium]
MATSSPDPARILACQVLYQVLEEGAFSNEALDQGLQTSNLGSQDRSFATALVYGCLGRVRALDKLLAMHSARPLDKIEGRVLTILRMGLWQILYAYSVPAFAAVDESVKLCQFFGMNRAKGFVNAILRKIDPDKIQWKKKDQGLALGLGNELFGLFRTWYGEETALDLGNYFLSSDFPLTVRVNPRKSSPERLTAKLGQEGYQVSPGLYLDSALRLDVGSCRLDQLPSFQAGHFMVQSEPAQMVGALSGAEEARSILDLCAAPGGKTCDLAERSQPGTFVLGLDLLADRLETARINAQRLGLPLHFWQGDATDPHLGQRIQEAFPDFPGQADLILLDVPCSGLGLLARKPELRLRVGYEDLKRFPPLQMAMLMNAHRLCRPGGRVIYSTCTLNPAENQDLVQAFLASEAGQDFSLEDLRGRLPERLAQVLVQDPPSQALLDQGFLLFRPDLTQTDGFFLCLLRKKG